MRDPTQLEKLHDLRFRVFRVPGSGYTLLLSAGQGPFPISERINPGTAQLLSLPAHSVFPIRQKQGEQQRAPQRLHLLPEAHLSRVETQRSVWTPAAVSVFRELLYGIRNASCCILEAFRNQVLSPWMKPPDKAKCVGLTAWPKEIHRS